MRRWRAAWLVLGLASVVGSTGFATCGSAAPKEETVGEEENAGQATIDEEQEDMYRDTDR